MAHAPRPHFLGMNDGRAYAVYSAYTALVYATPFIGGMLADRLLGARRAVVLDWPAEGGRPPDDDGR